MKKCMYFQSKGYILRPKYSALIKFTEKFPNELIRLMNVSFKVFRALSLAFKFNLLSICCKGHSKGQINYRPISRMFDNL